jgi:hypothetical protein
MDQVLNLQKVMTEEVIDNALDNMPPEAAAFSADKMKKLLLLRRDLLDEAIKNYYAMLAKQIFVIGTNDKEYFDLNRLPNGDVQVNVYQLTSKGIGKNIYSRLVKKSETEEIILYGLGKADEFNITGKSDKKIIIRIAGGSGKDKINDSSTIGRGKGSIVYAAHNKDEIQEHNSSKVIRLDQDLIFDTQNLFNYDYGMIWPFMGYNADDGFVAGFQYLNTKQGFAKPEFSSRTRYLIAGTTKSNFNLEYQKIKRRTGTFWDYNLELHATNRDRRKQYFYGLGNDTEKNADLMLNNYYRNEMGIYGGKLGFIRGFWQKSHFKPSVRIEYVDVNPLPLNQDGEGSGTIYDNLPKEFGVGGNLMTGMDLDFVLDFTDNPFLPRDGTKFKIHNFLFHNSNERLNVGGILSAETSLYISSGDRRPVTFAVRGGYVLSYGDTPFYQKAKLGQHLNNRGLNRNRFTGDRAAFVNTDLRFHLGVIQTPVIPLSYGIYGLFDLGRVWIINDNSNSWHTSFGGGFYIAPYSDAVSLRLSYARSDLGSGIFNLGLGMAID